VHAAFRAAEAGFTLLLACVGGSSEPLPEESAGSIGNNLPNATKHKRVVV
jgi:hypothetical protein